MIYCSGYRLCTYSVPETRRITLPWLFVITRTATRCYYLSSCGPRTKVHYTSGDRLVLDGARNNILYLRITCSVMY